MTNINKVLNKKNNDNVNIDFNKDLNTDIKKVKSTGTADSEALT